MPDDDLTVAPDFVLAFLEKYDTLVTTFENNVEQRRGKISTPVRSWRLEYRNRTASELSTIQTLFQSKLGQLTAFYWTNPLDSTQYSVRFATDTLEYKEKAYGIFDFEFELKQVI